MTNSLFHDLTYKNNHCGCFDDVHFEDLVSTVSLCYLCINAANTVMMYKNYHIAFQLRDLKDKKSWILPDAHF